jgi:hypothetical protein
MALIDYMPLVIIGAVLIPIAGIVGQSYNTRQKIKAGYPLEGMWGQSLKPGVNSEELERIKLLTQENAALRAEVSSVKERLANVERIVTDSGFHLSQQIAALEAQAPSVPLDLPRTAAKAR